MKDLTALFAPKSVAIIGASKSPEKVGAIVCRNISESGFAGKIYPINPSMEFKDMASLPEIPDLAVLAIPASGVVEALKQIGEKGTKNVVIFTAGFKEIGADGAQLETDLEEICAKYSLNVLGPNCLGYSSNLCPINVTFGQQVKIPGNLRFVSQSGALATGLFDWFTATGVGFSEFITLGNKAVINENDVLEYFSQTVGPVGLYLESIVDGQKFLEVAEKLSAKNPLFILKPGKSVGAAKAMQSHTGSIAGEDFVLEAALKQAGIIRCEELEDFFDLSRAFAWSSAPTGPRVAIISNAGGPAVISADAVAQYGLKLAEIPPETYDQLLKILPRTAAISDPVDVLGDALADRYGQAAEIVLESPQTDAIVAILTPQLMTQIDKTAEMMGALSQKYHKPIFCSFIGGAMVSSGEQVLNRLKIPSFRFPERAIKTIGAMWRWQQWSQQKLTQTAVSPNPTFHFDLEKIKEITGKPVDSLQANQLLLLAGISVPPSQEVTTIDQAQKFAIEVGFPVVLKLSSPELLHKTEVGGVIVGIKNGEQLAQSWEKLQQKMVANFKIQIQKQIENGVEVIVGVKRDPTFGPVMLFGAGGKFAELLVDRNMALIPADYLKVSDLVAGSKISKVLRGWRGAPPMALDKLYDLMVRLGGLVSSLPEISEMEINPVIMTLDSAWAVDGKVVLKSVESKASRMPNFKTATTLSHEIPASKYHEMNFETAEPVPFAPGQYFSVKVAPDRINAYSVASKIDDRHFMLLVDSTPGGPGSKFFESLKVGDQMFFLGPFGIFTFKPNDGAKKIVMMATGCGISAIRCMIEEALRSGDPTVPVYLFWGLRHNSDIFWKNYFEDLAVKFPNFKFKLVLSKPDENWQGETGHITETLKRDFPDLSEAAIYLCGNKAMIEETKTEATAMGCPKERMYDEKFF
jgi:acetyltransferase